MVVASTLRRACAIGACAAGSGFAFVGDAHGQTEARWLNAVSGSWFEPGLWDINLAPNNTPTESYRAIIDATGAAYEVTIDASVRLESLRIDSSDATVSVTSSAAIEAGLIELASGRLSLRHGELRRGVLEIGAGGSVDVGTGSVSNQSILEDMDVRGGSLHVDSNAQLRLLGTTTLDDTNLILTDASRLVFDGMTTLARSALLGESGSWRGSLTANTELVLATDSAILGDGGASFQLDANARLVNRGLINTDFDIEGGDSAGDGLFRNEGQMLFNRPSNLSVLLPFENAGTLTVSNGGSATLSSWTNAGTITLDEGGYLELRGGSWSNFGVIRQLGGEMELRASLLTSDLLAIERVGGRLTLDGGVLDNSRERLVLDEGLGDFVLGNVRIQGGVVINTNATNIVIGTPRSFGGFSGPQIEDVEWRGNLRIPEQTRVTIRGAHFEQGNISIGERAELRFESATFDPGYSIANRGGLLYLLGGSSLDGATVGLSDAATLSQLSPLLGDAAIGADTVVRVERGSITGGGFSGGVLTNFGRIEVLDGGDLFFGPGSTGGGAATFINIGEIVIGAGGVARLNGERWQNDGSIAIEGLLRILNPVTTDRLTGFRQQGDGVFEIGSTWDNAERVFNFNVTTGSYSFGRASQFLEGVRVTGGEFTFSDGHRLIGSNGVLDGVTIRAGGDFVLDRDGETFGLTVGGLTLPDGDLVLSGGGAGLYLLAGEHQFDTFTVSSRSTAGDSDRFIELLNAASLVIDANPLRAGGLVIRQQSNALGVRNVGLMESTDAGRVLRFTGASGAFENLGVVRALDGAQIAISTASFTNGVNAQITGGVGSELILDGASWVNDGVIAFGDNASVALIGSSWTNAGQVSLGANGVLAIGGEGANTGAITMAGPGVVELRSGATTALLNSIDRAGSDVVVRGDWLNGSSDTSLAGPGEWSFVSGSVQGGAIDLAGSRVATTQFTIRNTTLRDGMLAVQGQNARLRLDQGAVLERVDVALESGGAILELANNQSSINYDIRMQNAAGSAVQRVLLGSGATIAVDETGSIRGGNGVITGARSLVNQGVISADRSQQRLAVALQFSSFTNDGLVEATNGGLFQLVFTDLTNDDAGVLTGGAWRVEGDGSSIDLGGVAITENAASVELVGAGAQFDAIANLSRNVGQFALRAGYGFETIGAFENEGLLAIAGGAFLHVGGQLSLGGASEVSVTLESATTRTGASVMVMDQAMLAGSLHLALADGDDAAVGDRWSILTATSISGVFDSVTSSGLGHGQFFIVEYDATSATAVLVPSPAAAPALLVLLAVRRRPRRVA